ncbi:unnamed protein product [Lactuca virosa]|uniref:Protein SHORTAGE IN CHIASMATA 1 n=1 Tax=Lactuca virosa TaxID=75947 RepID=A0AAU9P5P6_9ASTR|nr:unnamed protein product [Lactuca virosa]
MRTRFLTDFFNSSATSQSLQTLDFLRFPPPQLPSPELFNFDNLCCFDQVTSLNIFPEIERFSVNESLSKFFSDVLPQYINSDIDQQLARTVTSEEKIDGCLDGASNNISKLVEFETPELQLSLKDSCILHEEKMQFFFEIADEEVNLDLLDFSHEVQKLLYIQKSIFHIEDYHLEFQEDHRSDIFDNGSLIQGQISSTLRTFPLLEIDETKFNILEHLLNHPPVPCHQFEVSCVKFDPEYIINAINHGYSSLTLTPLMFGDTTLITFNGLIVKHELTLRDDSFKSLPVPIFSDHEKILSVQEIVEEVFLKLKLQPSSTSDDIYLDWHLLEEDISNSSHNISTSLKMFEDIDTYSVDANMKSCDIQISILEFVLFDECSDEQKCKENIEVLKIQMSGNLMDSVPHNGIASSKLNDTSKKMEIGEALVDNKVNKDPQFVESMSEFNDLDFFLNSLEDTFVKKQKATDKKLEMDYTLPVVSSKSLLKTHDTTKIPELPSAMESKKINTNTSSLPDAIIIVNTQNVDTEMIISRRSTYQKILAMEKEGVQVVERDLNLPVDVIISAAVCLVLYDIKNIRTKTSSSDSECSSCVENIAANVLTSISFAFSGCILIFEGEVGFLGGIMESSDELYAAAASLGIDLQLFCSYSCDTTDEIIVNCISHAAKSTKGLYPKMPESETLAESFLSRFPSVNPLSAHAILSSVGSLIQFLEMPHQQRVCAVKKYLVPESSIILFTALCKYGEREDSKSGMTDCCSSVSSGHDSGNCCPKIDHESKKRKYIDMPMNMNMDYSFNDVTWDTPKTNMDFDEMYFGEKQRSKGLQEGYKGQVIDISDDDMAGEDFTFGHTESFPTRSAPDNYGTRKNDWWSLPSFPTAAEITLNSQTDLMENVTTLEVSSIVNSPMNFL